MKCKRTYSDYDANDEAKLPTKDSKVLGKYREPTDGMRQRTTDDPDDVQRKGN